jgi:hypothetical protein
MHVGCCCAMHSSVLLQVAVNCMCVSGRPLGGLWIRIDWGSDQAHLHGVLTLVDLARREGCYGTALTVSHRVC